MCGGVALRTPEAAAGCIVVVDPCVAGCELEVVDGVYIEVLDGEMCAGLQCDSHCTVLRFGTDDVFKRDVIEHDLIIGSRAHDDVIAITLAEEEAVHAVLAAGEGIIAKAAVERSRSPAAVGDAVV